MFQNSSKLFNCDCQRFKHGKHKAQILLDPEFAIQNFLGIVS